MILLASLAAAGEIHLADGSSDELARVAVVLGQHGQGLRTPAELELRGVCEARAFGCTWLSFDVPCRVDQLLGDLLGPSVREEPAIPEGGVVVAGDLTGALGLVSDLCVAGIAAAYLPSIPPGGA